jgi:hypothetical protein
LLHYQHPLSTDDTIQLGVLRRRTVAVVEVASAKAAEKVELDAAIRKLYARFSELCWTEKALDGVGVPWRQGQV